MSFLEIRALEKSFGDHVVLSGVNLSVDEAEVLALLGPSGSGKTTLLRLLAGFERPDDGEILVAGEAVDSVPPARRGFGMVFQHYALFPHMTVGENVAFGLAGWGLSEARVAERIMEVLDLVDMAGFEDRSVTRISGGQQQRVALARAVAPKPRLLLLDEPLSNLDPDLRERTRRRLRETLRTIGITTILVTHEQDEAFDLGDRVAVLEAGRLQQVGRPQVIYRQPANRFVAGFVGRASLVPGILGEGGVAAVGADARGRQVDWTCEMGEDAPQPGDRIELAVRPESLELLPAGSGGALGGQVLESRFVGMVSLVLVELDAGARVEVAAEREAAPGERIAVGQRGESLRPRGFRLAGEASS